MAVLQVGHHLDLPAAAETSPGGGHYVGRPIQVCVVAFAKICSLHQFVLVFGTSLYLEYDTESDFGFCRVLYPRELW